MHKAILITAVCAVFFGVAPQTSSAASTELIERAIHVFFPTAPHMVAVARCESGLRQYDATGVTLRGGYGGRMIGLFQLHETYHRAAAQAMGYNIDSLFGNLAYARELYRTEGTTPWLSSEHCWSKTAAQKPAIVVAEERPTITSTLRFGAKGPEVSTLQNILTQVGYIGAETTIRPGVFDVPTFVALAHFQCDRGIACLSTGPRTELGKTGPGTRAALTNIDATS